eukprot:scaffold34980_cov69-Phaeocystis_antarctica.AAC.1
MCISPSGCCRPASTSASSVEDTPHAATGRREGGGVTAQHIRQTVGEDRRGLTGAERPFSERGRAAGSDGVTVAIGAAAVEHRRQAVYDELLLHTAAEKRVEGRARPIGLTHCHHLLVLQKRAAREGDDGRASQERDQR